MFYAYVMTFSAVFRNLSTAPSASKHVAQHAAALNTSNTGCGKAVHMCVIHRLLMMCVVNDGSASLCMIHWAVTAFFLSVNVDTHGHCLQEETYTTTCK